MKINLKFKSKTIPKLEAGHVYIASYNYTDERFDMAFMVTNTGSFVYLADGSVNLNPTTADPNHYVELKVKVVADED